MMVRVFALAMRSRHVAAALAVLTLFCLSPQHSLDAQDPDPTVVRVEQDWELVLKTPDQNSAGPQVVCTISPFNHVSGVHAAVELNHQSLPQFVPGGIQVQAWDDENPLGSQKFPNASLLSHDNETVSWTQSMRLENGSLIMEVTDGTSQSWGNFGGQGYLKWSIATQLTSLEAYSTDVTVANSGVSYGANLVEHLEIKEVRLIMSDGTVIVSASDVCICGSH